MPLRIRYTEIFNNQLIVSKSLLFEYFVNRHVISIFYNQPSYLSVILTKINIHKTPFDPIHLLTNDFLILT